MTQARQALDHLMNSRAPDGATAEFRQEVGGAVQVTVFVDVGGDE